MGAHAMTAASFPNCALATLDSTTICLALKPCLPLYAAHAECPRLLATTSWFAADMLRSAITSGAGLEVICLCGLCLGTLSTLVPSWHTSMPLAISPKLGGMNTMPHPERTLPPLINRPIQQALTRYVWTPHLSLSTRKLTFVHNP